MALVKIGVSERQEQQGLLDARGAAHRRELAAMQLYQSRLEQQIQSLRKDKEHMMALNHELSRSAEAAGVVQSQQIAQLQRSWADLERDAASERHDIESGMERAEMQAMKREITRLELEVDQGKMHVKELLFSQKLERLQHAQMVEQKRRETDAKEGALKEIRDLKHELQVERVQISALTAGLTHAETTVESFKGRNIDKRHEVIEDLTRQLNNLKALTDDLWARLHAANKKLSQSSEEHEKHEHQLSFTIDQLRTKVATLTEEQEHMWDQASSVALRAMSQHHRELLHNIEVETFNAIISILL
jgi:chromosome segregation ATPase